MPEAGAPRRTLRNARRAMYSSRSACSTASEGDFPQLKGPCPATKTPGVLVCWGASVSGYWPTSGRPPLIPFEEQQAMIAVPQPSHSILSGSHPDHRRLAIGFGLDPVGSHRQLDGPLWQRHAVQSSDEGILL